jgi:hypothetical protein
MNDFKTSLVLLVGCIGSLPVCLDAQTQPVVRGTLMYRSVAPNADQPDTGSNIYVVKGTLSSPRDDETFVSIGDSDAGWMLLRISATCLKSQQCKYPLAAQALADGDGNFLIELPAGEYTVLVVSSHTANEQASKKAQAQHVVLQDGRSVNIAVNFGTDYFTYQRSLIRRR